MADMANPTQITRWQIVICGNEDCANYGNRIYPVDHCARVRHEKAVDVVPVNEVVSFTAEELQCLTCAMAGNFPEQFAPIRMDLLRKLAKASRAVMGEDGS